MARHPDVSTQSGPQRVIALVRSSVPPVHPAGLPFVAAGLAVAALGRNHRWVRNLGLAAAGANAGFFRHPPVFPNPARRDRRSGRRSGVPDGHRGATTRTRARSEPVQRISIFLSLLDAHVQRAPVGGEVTAVAYRPGRFYSADLPEASDDNERNSVVIRTPEGQEVVVVQIAGLLARRIVCDVHEGDRIGIGDTYGLIRYGSRLDTYAAARLGGADRTQPTDAGWRDRDGAAAMIKPRPQRTSKGSPMRMLPSAMTVLAICLGMTSVKFALEQRPTEAMALLAAAAVLDALDGRVARCSRPPPEWARKSTRWRMR